MFAKPHKGNSVCLFEVFSRDLFFDRQTRNKSFGKDKKKFAQTTSVIAETENSRKAENKQDLEKTLVELNDEKVSEKLNEKKLKREVLAEKNTGLKEATKKSRQSGPTEKELWDRLDTFNKKFVQAKQHKKNKSKKNLIA